jgi:hypothetical protein
LYLASGMDFQGLGLILVFHFNDCCSFRVKII